MRKVYAIIAALLVGCTAVLAQPLAPQSAGFPRVQPAGLTARAPQAAGTLPQRVTIPQDEGLRQPAKWLTNLPVDSAILVQNLNPSNIGYDLGHSTILSSELVEYFVGNRITKVKTIIPACPVSSILFYIIDADNREDTLYRADLPNETRRDTIIDIPCDAYISKSMNIHVGFTMHCTDTVAQHAYIVPCNRLAAWLMWDEVNNDQLYYDYTFMRNLLYKDPNLCYGYYFHCITEGDGGLREYDFKLTGATYARAYLGEYGGFKVDFLNYGVADLAQVKFRCTMGDEEKYVEIDRPIGYLGSASFDAGFAAPTEPVRIPLSAQLVEVSHEPVVDGPKLYSSITAIDRTKSVARRVVMEEFTGTWCGWCPRGMRAMELLSEKWGDDFIPVAVHYNDQFQCADYGYVLDNFSTGGFPGCTVNRLVIGADPYYGSNQRDFGIERDLDDVRDRATEATVQINAVDWDAEEQMFTVETSTNFSISCKDSPYALSFAITEDGQKAAQANYYSSAKYGSDPAQIEANLRDFCAMSSPAAMSMNHIGRALYGPNGLEGTLSGEIKPDVPIVCVNEVPMPASVVNPAETNIIVMIIDKESGEIINAAALATKPLTGLTKTTADAAAADVQAEAGGVRISAAQGVVSVYSPDGRRLRSANVAGDAFLPLPTGCYVVSVKTPAGVSSHKVSIR